MKMLVLIFRSSLEQDVLELLKEVEVKAFTEAPKVMGMGETGSTFQPYGLPGHNAMILAAMEEAQVDRVVKRFKTFRDTLAHRQHAAKIPLRVFVFPCESLL